MGYNQKTVRATSVPIEMRIPYIHSGYRLMDQPWSYYIKSLCHLHNETVNVWTHLIGSILIAYQIFTYFAIYSNHGSELRWTVLGFGVLCFLTLFNSAVAHLLHSKSTYTNYLIFMYDYLGVVSWGFATAFLAVYGVSERNTYYWIGPYFIPMQLVFTYINFINICLSKLWYGHDLGNMNRKLMMVGGIMIQAIFNFVPWLPRYVLCYYLPECHLSSLNHISLVCLSFVVMTSTFVLHQPEKRFPGSFDIIGQSHQIFHIVVIVTQSLQFRALYIDFLAEANFHCKPNIFHTVICIVLLNLAGFITMFYFKDSIKTVLDRNKTRHLDRKKTECLDENKNR